MKRKLPILLAAVLSLILFGCTAQVEETQPEEVHIFTDAFFEDVVEIRDFPCGEVSGAQMEPVIQYLKGLKLTATDKHIKTHDENGNPYYGGHTMITFVKSNGDEMLFLKTIGIFTFSDETGTYSYEVEEGINLNLGLQEAFNQALEQSDH